MSGICFSSPVRRPDMLSPPAGRRRLTRPHFASGYRGRGCPPMQDHQMIREGMTFPDPRLRMESCQRVYELLNVSLITQFNLHRSKTEQARSPHATIATFCTIDPPVDSKLFSTRLGSYTPLYLYWGRVAQVGFAVYVYGLCFCVYTVAES